MRIKTCLIFFAASAVFSFQMFSQEVKPKEADTALQSRSLQAEAADLDKQIADLSKKISEAIVKYRLYAAKDVPAAPYQISFDSKDGYVSLTRHYIIKDDFNKGIAGRREKIMKIYTDGTSISKIESTIREKEDLKSTDNRVVIIDPSPLSEDTSDIVFSHIYNGRALVDNKSIRDIKNTTAFPIANNIKRDFYVPHLQYFYSTIVSIGESYQKGIKDNEGIMSDLLKKSTDY